jgi:glomulin
MYLFLKCFLVTCFICFAVLWTYMYDDLSKYAEEELELALSEVQENHTKKWEAINMLRYVLSSFRYPWIIKSHCINLLLILAVENRIGEINDDVDFTSHSPRIFATLKVLFYLFLENVVFVFLKYIALTF